MKQFLIKIKCIHTKKRLFCRVFKRFVFWMYIHFKQQNPSTFLYFSKMLCLFSIQIGQNIFFPFFRLQNQPENFLKIILIFTQKWGSFSYKVVSYKKKECNSKAYISLLHGSHHLDNWHGLIPPTRMWAPPLFHIAVVVKRSLKNTPRPFVNCAEPREIFRRDQQLTAVTIRRGIISLHGCD